MPLLGFEPTISGGERPQTYALDRTVTGTGSYVFLTWGKWRKTYIYIYPQILKPRHCMERKGQLHVPTALSQAVSPRYVWIESWVVSHIRSGHHAEETSVAPAANLTSYLSNTALGLVTTAKVSSLVPSK
jgi:hypothetical protein